jgi:hypothetical protein
MGECYGFVKKSSFPCKGCEILVIEIGCGCTPLPLRNDR